MLEADIGKVVDAHWAAEAPQDVVSVLAPELLALTPTTFPGGADDPVERLSGGEWTQGYLDLDGALGEADYLPPRMDSIADGTRRGPPPTRIRDR